MRKSLAKWPKFFSFLPMILVEKAKENCYFFSRLWPCFGGTKWKSFFDSMTQFSMWSWNDTASKVQCWSCVCNVETLYCLFLTRCAKVLKFYRFIKSECSEITSKTVIVEICMYVCMGQDYMSMMKDSFITAYSMWFQHIKTWKKSATKFRHIFPIGEFDAVISWTDFVTHYGRRIKPHHSVFTDKHEFGLIFIWSN